jgi:hypothetical protein
VLTGIAFREIRVIYNSYRSEKTLDASAGKVPMALLTEKRLKQNVNLMSHKVEKHFWR